MACPTHAGHAALRRGRTSLGGQIYLVTFTTHRRKPLFIDPLAARVVSRRIGDSRIWLRSTLLAWVLMPDHWHGLIQLDDRDELSVLVCKIKSNSARWLRVETGMSAPVWARAFHDHALRRDEDLVATARYVVLNPVRGGLVKHVADYPYWNAIWL